MAKEEKKKDKQLPEGALTVRTETQTLPTAPQLERIPTVDTEKERLLLEQQTEAARQQTEGQIDRTVEQGVQELQRAEEEAQAGFQSMRDRTEIEERQALDEQALYAELRGDRGGIGLAQAASIRNTAAVNRRQVNLEQQRLATDTARQIEQLRRQGEFEKADAVLQLRQKQLSELLELERWAKDRNLSIGEFNSQLARWEAEYAWQLRKFGVQTELSLAQMSGRMPDGSPTLAARQSERSRLAAAAKMLLELGLELTPDQIEALGWTEGQYEAFVQQSRQPAGAGVGTGDGARSGGEGEGVPFQMLAAWTASLQGSDDPAETLRQIRGSDWFGQLSAAQSRQLAAVLREKGLL